MFSLIDKHNTDLGDSQNFDKLIITWFIFAMYSYDKGDNIIFLISSAISVLFLVSLVSTLMLNYYTIMLKNALDE